MARQRDERRVVVTGLGVVAPNGTGLDAFERAIRKGESGIRHMTQLKELNFGCEVAGVPEVSEAVKQAYFHPLTLRFLKSTGIIYGCIAGMDAWKDAGFDVPDAKNSHTDWDSGTVFGTGSSGVDALRDAIYQIDIGQTRQLGSRIVEQTMASGPSAYLGGMLALGNQVTSNSSACCTGTEAMAIAYDRIRSGRARRMIAGSCESEGPYVWGGFDAMRVLNRNANEKPQKASRPMSATAAGFVPGAGSGALLLEDLESALNRKARIYAEVMGVVTNSGGQRQGGTMTAANPEGVRRCILEVLETSGIEADQIDAISGHLTATTSDVKEISQWVEALGRAGEKFPYINATKSMIGHCLGAAGAIECVAVVLQLYKGFFHPSVNCEDLHPGIAQQIAVSRIPQEVMTQTGFDIITKASFGFGDVNSCLVFKKWINA